MPPTYERRARPGSPLSIVALDQGTSGEPPKRGDKAESRAWQAWRRYNTATPRPKPPFRRRP